MPLKEYQQKRDFRKTPEPRTSKKPKRRESLAYAIQKHLASHLHYDLRLEEGGVLKSWAIPKLPPLKEGVRRLAVETEDHPLGYEEFEGVIPEGEYGAGKVEIWDAGTYLPLEIGPAKRIFELRGQKLKGRYALIRLPDKKAGGKNWLFFRIKNPV